jgi:hypothetical protein
MRIRSKLGLFILSVLLAIGCRRPLSPATTNLPPETWITAAPQDTITARDENGNILPPEPGTIPFRFHAYWSGSDQDGTVAGFYWAVVETAGVSGLAPPPLPGPRAQDYHYTTARDSTFIFNVFEGTNNRQHGLYLYAVDDKGKPDPTPARVIFDALDLFPPVPVIEAECGVKNPVSGSRATGYIFHANEAWDGVSAMPVPRETTIALCDTFVRGRPTSTVVPMGSRVHIQWHSEIRVANNPAVGYKYKIGESNEVEFVQVPASVTSTEYNTTDDNRLGPGLKIFTLRAIDQAGGARTSPETTRRFYMNMIPDTWFAGPDPAAAGNPFFYTTVTYANGQVKDRYRQVGTGTTANWTTAFPGSYLGDDSLKKLPGVRAARKTFFEIYSEYNFTNPALPAHRVYVRGEGDTIHMNSKVLLFAGGFDPDSPYDPRITLDYRADTTKPYLIQKGRSPVETEGPPNGSPSGLRFHIPIRFDSTGAISPSVQSQVFPLSEPTQVGEYHIGAYQAMQQAGRAYAILRSVDGDGRLDDRIADPVAFVDSIERGQIGPGMPRYALRDKVLTFYVDRAPYLLPGFEPYPGEDVHGRSIPLRLDLVADDDPYRNSQRDPGGVTPESLPRVLRFSVFLRGRRAGSVPPRDTIYAPDNLKRRTGVEGIRSIEIPSYMEGPQIAVEIEICDCEECEAAPGTGRCRRIPATVVNLVAP